MSSRTRSTSSTTDARTPGCVHAIWIGAFAFAVPFLTWGAYVQSRSRVIAAIAAVVTFAILFALRRRAFKDERKRTMHRNRLDEPEAITYTPAGWSHYRPTHAAPTQGASMPQGGGFTPGGGSFGGGGASGSW